MPDTSVAQRLIDIGGARIPSTILIDRSAGSLLSGVDFDHAFRCSESCGSAMCSTRQTSARHATIICGQHRTTGSNALINAIGATTHLLSRYAARASQPHLRVRRLRGIADRYPARTRLHACIVQRYQPSSRVGVRTGTHASLPRNALNNLGNISSHHPCRLSSHGWS